MLSPGIGLCYFSNSIRQRGIGKGFTTNPCAHPFFCSVYEHCKYRIFYQNGFHYKTLLCWLLTVLAKQLAWSHCQQVSQRLCYALRAKSPPFSKQNLFRRATIASRMAVFTLPKGICSRSAISAWVYPWKYARWIISRCFVQS